MTSTEELRKAITERVEAFAKENGYSFSESKDAVINDLVRMHKRFGDYYCPCQMDNTPATVCVCESVRNGLVDAEGACFCYFFVSGSSA